MALYKARVRQEADGSWVAAAVALPNCWSRGAGRDEALAKLRDEIRYRIEYCPCTGVDDEFVRVEVIAAEEKGAAQQAAVSTWAAGRPAPPAPLSGAAGCPRQPSRHVPASTDAASPATAPSNPRRHDWRRWDD